MTEALLFVLAEPGPVPEEEFHDWYDTEHGPARLGVPGIRTGYRYHALDGQKPSWLAWYELDSAALDSPEYEIIRHRSPREQDIVDRLTTLDRRVYELLDDRGTAPPEPAVVVAVQLSTSDPDGLDAWYRTEHLPLLHRMDGWYRTRRYRRTSGAGPDFLAFHEISDVRLFDADEYRHATSTPARTQVMDRVTARERRVFGFHRRISR
ncbi:hypothetical protein [Amycolatopsis jejuensis]|uniref:hypothetical protein n=1 Tax=Amycolatopsis jejuensis TaxID=330084 RepID=UPI00068FC4E7|nr:hypothetical protein [Amycolatopsis jejuensis]